MGAHHQARVGGELNSSGANLHLIGTSQVASSPHVIGDGVEELEANITLGLPEDHRLALSPQIAAEFVTHAVDTQHVGNVDEELVALDDSSLCPPQAQSRDHSVMHPGAETHTVNM
ncbi:hypothetical protein VNO78_10306 [Psophocarpus tetragonolobus]|uniref:Uncharacterized protein n=1 Tax=Psophocarpus tetragonolobus TaxID=3891 RepID=A0AAN9XML8_PSOTE